MTQLVYSAFTVSFSWSMLIVFIAIAWRTKMSKELASAFVAGGCGPAALAGLALFYARLQRIRRLIPKFILGVARGDKPMDIHRFRSVFEAETLIKAVLANRGPDGQHDLTSVELAVEICHACSFIFPDSAYTCLLYSSVLAHAKGDLQAGQSQVEKGKKMPKKSLPERFQLFAWGQLHQNKINGGSGEGMVSTGLSAFLGCRPRSHMMPIYVHMCRT